MAIRTSITLESPAKINLVLLIEGLRSDGFHNLFSIVAPISLQDTLTITLGTLGKSDSIECAGLMGDLSFMADNLVLKAANKFRARFPFKESINFKLEKHIPIGAGLGGGSTNAVAAIKGLNMLLKNPLSKEEMISLAAEIGSDCPLFLENGPCIIKGRGEHIAPLPEIIRNVLVNKNLLVFKPSFPISTPWAYQEIRAHSAECYQSAATIEEFYKHWQNKLLNNDIIELSNTFEKVIFPKFLALPTLLDDLRKKFGLNCGMTGSGSACFAFINNDTPIEEITNYIRSCWGEDTPVIDCFIKN